MAGTQRRSSRTASTTWITESIEIRACRSVPELSRSEIIVAKDSRTASMTNQRRSGELASQISAMPGPGATTPTLAGSTMMIRPRSVAAMKATTNRTVRAGMGTPVC